MKILKKILIFVIIAVVIQSSILIYLDKYYFNTDSKVTIENKSSKIKLKQNNEEYKLSYDGNYISYLEGDNLKVVSTRLGTNNTIKFESNKKICFYKWFPESNKIIIAEKTMDSKDNIITFHCYYIINKNTFEIKEENSNTLPYIREPNSMSQVEDVIISSTSNSIFVKLSKPGQYYSIYKIENMSSVSRIADNKYKIGKVDINEKSEKIYYADLGTNEIESLDKDVKKISGFSEVSFLGIDKSGKMYIGDVSNGFVKNICWGNCDDALTSWNKKQLPDSVELKNIYFSKEGKVYINDNLKGTVTELISGIQTEYIGIQQNMFANGIASNEKGYLVITRFKE